MRIAIFVYDRHQSELASEALGRAGHLCHTFPDERELLARLRREDCDLLVTEAAHGLSLAAFLAAIRSGAARDIPILLLANRSEEETIVAALDAGIGDYLVKPLRRGELVARVGVLLRRTYPEQHAAEKMAFGQYAFEPRTRQATKSDSPIELTQKEFDLALLFFRNLGRPLSRAYILEAVWPHDADVPSRTMDTHVSRIRNKLALRPENGFRLVPVYSYGYRLEQIPA